VPLPEDQHAVGQLGADGQQEALGEAVVPHRQLLLMPTVEVEPFG